MELSALEKTGGIDPETRFNEEEKLRKEYQSRIGDYNKTLVTYDNIRSSGKDPTGAGDVALVTSFMNMLDPESVVRESEFATASNTGGLFARLETILPKLKKGEFLTAEQRNNFVNLAGKYMKAYTDMEERHRNDLQNVVQNYGLNPNNVFGEIAKNSEELKALREYIKKNNPGTKVNVDIMDEEELKNAFPNGYNTFTGSTTNNTIEVDY